MQKIKQADADRLADGAAEIEAIYDELDGLLAEARETIAAKVAELNEKKNDVYGALEDLAREAEEFYDEKSERWQGGDRGEAYREWKDELEQRRSEMEEDLELEMPEDPDRPDWLGVLREGIQTEPNA